VQLFVLDTKTEIYVEFRPDYMSGRLRALGDIQFPVCCLLLTMIDVVDFTVTDNVEAGVVFIQKTAGDLPPCGHR
jgi:hypothetical protein